MQLRLYVAGNAPNSLRAMSNLRALCEEHFAGAYTLELVDMLDFPLRALEDGVLVTPTLLKLVPGPVRRVVGDLGDSKQLLIILAST